MNSKHHALIGVFVSGHNIIHAPCRIRCEWLTGRNRIEPRKVFQFQIPFVFEGWFHIMETKTFIKICSVFKFARLVLKFRFAFCSHNNLIILILMDIISPKTIQKFSQCVHISMHIWIDIEYPINMIFNRFGDYPRSLDVRIRQTTS